MPWLLVFVICVACLNGKGGRDQAGSATPLPKKQLDANPTSEQTTSNDPLDRAKKVTESKDGLQVTAGISLGGIVSEAEARLSGDNAHGEVVFYLKCVTDDGGDIEESWFDTTIICPVVDELSDEKPECDFECEGRECNPECEAYRCDPECTELNNCPRRIPVIDNRAKLFSSGEQFYVGVEVSGDHDCLTLEAEYKGVTVEAQVDLLEEE